MWYHLVTKLVSKLLLFFFNQTFSFIKKNTINQSILTFKLFKLIPKIFTNDKLKFYANN